MLTDPRPPTGVPVTDLHAVVDGARPVALVRFPDEAERRSEAARDGVPCLLVVEPGAPFPALASGEDAVRSSADEQEVAVRLAELARRGRRALGTPIVLAHLGAGLEGDARRVLLRLAAEAGRLVPHRESAAVLVEDPTAPLAELLASASRHVTGHGWRIVAVGEAGHLLEPVESGAS